MGDSESERARGQPEREEKDRHPEKRESQREGSQSLTCCIQVMAVIDSVEAAIPLLKNVALLFGFLIALFSIMGTQLLAGTLRTQVTD